MLTLTPKQRAITELICEGCSNRGIAGILKISEQTVKNSISLILGRNRLFNRAHLAAKFTEEQLGQQDKTP